MLKRLASIRALKTLSSFFVPARVMLISSVTRKIFHFVTVSVNVLPSAYTRMYCTSATRCTWLFWQ